MQLLPYAILDMDGTLLDSSGMWDRVAVQVLAPWGVTYTPAERDDTMTMTIDGTAAYFVQRFSLPVSPAEMAASIRKQASGAYAAFTTVKPGVPRALDAMRARGVRLCAASGTEKALVDGALAHFGLLDRFDFTLDCATPRGKADPEVYLRAAGRFGARPEQIMVFEDSPTAVRTAGRAGFYTVGVLDAYTRPHWAQVRADADAVLGNWTDWAAQLD